MLYVSNSSRPTLVRKRGQCTTERVCEPTPAERVARDAEIPDRTSYRYDTSSESFFPHQTYSLSSSPLCPLDHSPIHDFSSPRRSGPLCIFCLNSYTSFGIQVIYAHIHRNICPTMNFDATEHLCLEQVPVLVERSQGLCLIRLLFEVEHPKTLCSNSCLCLRSAFKFFQSLR